MGETGGLVGLPPDETRKNPPGIIGGQRPKAISSHNFCREQESGQKSPDFRRGYDWHNDQWTVPIKRWLALSRVWILADRFVCLKKTEKLLT